MLWQVYLGELRDHITSVLASLHWLPVKYRTGFKILLLTYKALNDQAPSYLKELVELCHTTRTQAIISRQVSGSFLYFFVCFL